MTAKLSDQETSAIRQALVGCRIELRVVGTDGAFPYEIISVTEPPRKPEVKVHGAPMWNKGEQIVLWYEGEPTELRITISLKPDYWLRRETIDGIAQTPVVVTGEAK